MATTEATARTEADPYGMTNKKGKDKSNNGNSRSSAFGEG
jgi:hypothetical protein